MHAIYIGSSHCSVRLIIEMFSDYSLLLDVTVLVWQLKKIMQSTVELTFLSFTFKPEVHSSSEMFVITK